MRRLRARRVDLMQVHSRSMGTRISPTLREWKRDGLLRRLGSRPVPGLAAEVDCAPSAAHPSQREVIGYGAGQARCSTAPHPVGCPTRNFARASLRRSGEEQRVLRLLSERE